MNPIRSFMQAPVRFLGRLSATVRLLVGLSLAAVGWVLAPAGMDAVSRWVAAWDMYAASTLLLIGAAMVTADTASIRKVANAEDLSRTVAFIFVLGAALASLLAVVALLGTMKASGGMQNWHIILSIAAVVESWLLVHTVFTLRYAHIYYDADEKKGGDTGGLDFPGGDPEPNYLDFAYFAFTLGMTAQTADVAISGRRQRHTALLHALISFSFNTAIIALSISAIGGLF